MMKKIFLIISIIIFSQILLAQRKPIKWKKVPLSDLKMTSYEQDLSASAVVLCDYGEYYFDTNPNGENLFFFQFRHVRIKILTKEGLKYAKISIPFVDMDYERFNRENSIIVKGMVYNLDNNDKLIHKKLRNRDIEYRDSIKGIKIAEFELPDVKVGSVIDYYYTKPSLNFINLPSWAFQADIPIIHSELRISIPRYFEYICIPINFRKFDVLKEDYYSRTLMLRNNNKHSINYNQVISYDLGGKKIQFIKKNNPAIKHEKFVINKKSGIERLKIHLVKAINENRGYLWEKYTHALFATTQENYDEYQPIQRKNIFYPVGLIVYSIKDWEDVNKKLIESSRFGLPMIKHWKYKKVLDSLTRDKTNKLDKMIAIYDFVRKNIKWNGINSIYVKSVYNSDLTKLYTRITKKMVNEKSLQRPFDARIGTSSEINLILISLLNKAGIKTNAVVLSRRDNEKITAEIPNPKQFNNVIARVIIDDKEIFLDATDPSRSYKLLDNKQLSNSAFLVDARNYAWISTHNMEKTTSIINENLTITDDYMLKREYELILSGYEAINFRKQLVEKGKITDWGTNSVLSSLPIKSIINVEKDDKPLIFKFETETDKFNDTLIVNFKLKPKYESEDFYELPRINNVELDYPFEQIYNLKIKLPKTFTCKITDNKHINACDKKASFSINTLKNAETINISTKISINAHTFATQEYSKLGQFFEQTEIKLHEQIIIEK